MTHPAIGVPMPVPSSSAAAITRLSQRALCQVQFPAFAVHALGETVLDTVQARYVSETPCFPQCASIIRC
jgi:hypothetical protein